MAQKLFHKTRSAKKVIVTVNKHISFYNIPELIELKVGK